MEHKSSVLIASKILSVQMNNSQRQHILMNKEGFKTIQPIVREYREMTYEWINAHPIK
jgi:hypothetical protein